MRKFIAPTTRTQRRRSAQQVAQRILTKSSAAMTAPIAAALIAVPFGAIGFSHLVSFSDRNLAATPTAQIPVRLGLFTIDGAIVGGTTGYGTVRPRVISNGGDPTGVVGDVTWRSWGGPLAEGIGSSDYVAPGQDVAGGTLEKAIVVASDLSRCGSTYVYRAVQWYFPSDGQKYTAISADLACPPVLVPGQWQVGNKLAMTGDSVGAVKTGMSLAQASRAAGSPLIGKGDGEYGTSSNENLIAYFSQNRVSCLLSYSDLATTSRGITVGDKISQAIAAYGASSLHFSESSSPAGGAHTGYVLESPVGNMVFLFYDGVINGIEVGPSVTSASPC